MAPPKPEALTPIRSPMPRRSDRRKSDACAATAAKKRRTAVASSSEKETPTVVFTETSPFARTPATGDGANARSVTATADLLAVAPSRPLPEEPCRETSRSSTSSPPGSEAGQSPTDGSRGASSASSRGDHGGDRGSPLTRSDVDDDVEVEDDDYRSVDSDEAKKLQVVTMVQNLLDSGIASICRLRGLFPSRFFQKYDFVDGTTITRFNKRAIWRICSQAGMDMDEVESHLEYYEDGDDHQEEEEAYTARSMVKSFDAKTQRSLSPLTEFSPKGRVPGSDQDDVVYSEREKRLAMEALLILRWMQTKGVGEVLKGGFLARVVFGICMPSEKSLEGVAGEDANNDELIESYSFSISCDKPPENPSEVNVNEVFEGTGSFFQNLNGFQAGRSLSQSVVPRKTQSSFAGTQASFHPSQASRATSYYGGTRISSVDLTQNFSLSQKHHCFPQSQMEISQKSLMASMSQSVRASVKKNRACKIPSKRYLTLRVDFTKSIQQNELPYALQQKDRSSTPSSLMTSPVPIMDRNVVKPVASGTMHVTPLGRIVENGYSGICVDVAAHSIVAEDDVDEQSVNAPQFSWHSQTSESMHLSQTQEDEKAQFLKEDRGSDEGEQRENDESTEDEYYTQAAEDEAASALGFWPGETAANRVPGNGPVTSKDDGRAGKTSMSNEAMSALDLWVGEIIVNIVSELCDVSGAGDDSHSESKQVECDKRQTKHPQKEAENKENAGIRVGGKAFGQPYGLKCARTYIFCDVRDHRIMKSCINGIEREEFKCSFHSDELKLSGKKKQWIIRSRLTSFASMVRNVEDALKKWKRANRFVIDEVSKEVNVDPEFVRKVARKRKSNLREGRRQKRSQRNVCTSNFH